MKAADRNGNRFQHNHFHRHEHRHFPVDHVAGMVSSRPPSKIAMSELFQTTELFQVSAIAFGWFLMIMGLAILLLSFRHQSHSRNATTETEQTTTAAPQYGRTTTGFTASGSISPEVNRQK